MRLGLRLVKGLARKHADAIVAARRDGPFRSPAELARRAGLPRGVLRRLAQADAVRSMGLDRRAALWRVLAIDKEADALPLFADQEPDEPAVSLPDMPLGAHIVYDYYMTGLSLKAHPVELVRRELKRRRIGTTADARCTANGRWIDVAGLVICRQRPETASGVVFVTIEDETGAANTIIRPKLYDRDRTAIRHATLLKLSGPVQRDGEVVHVLAQRVEDLTHLLPQVMVESRDFC